MQICRGITRIVFLTKNYAIKIPTFKNHLHFLQGCLSNYKERHYNKIFKNMPEFLDLVAPSLFCSIFGLIQIQKRCKPFLSEIDENILERFKNFDDIKPQNLGYFNDELVILDYG